MAFTNEQLTAIEAQGKVIVSASAGSGKTTVMIEKIIRLIISGVGVDEILAVTFTKKAAAQMKEKLSNKLIEEINKPDCTPEKRANLKRQLAKVPDADISTIHSYCARLIRSRFFAAGVDSGFRVIGSEDAEGRALKGQALDELLEEGYEAQDEAFLHLLSSYWRNKKDVALRKIFDKTYGSLRDRADYRAYLERNKQGYTQAQFDEICGKLLQFEQEKSAYYLPLVTAERDAFVALRKQMLELVGEKKAKKLNILKNQIEICQMLIDGLQRIGAATEYFQIKNIYREVTEAPVNGEYPKRKFPQNKVTYTEELEARVSEETKAEIAKHKETLGFLKERTADELEEKIEKLADYETELARFLSSGKTAAALAEYLLRFDEKYAALKTERGVLDYNDLEHKALALLDDPEIAEETKKRYRYVFVDEYQDVNPVQESIVSKLSGENLFLVGDVKQSIYGFRGSKSKFFVEKQAEFAAGQGQNLFMKNNFRSTDQVLDAVNKQFVLAMTPQVCSVDYAADGRMEKGGRYALNSGKVAVHFVGRDKGGSTGERGVYSVIEHAKAEDEEFGVGARAIAKIIEAEVGSPLEATAGGNATRYAQLSDIAILTRKTKGTIEREVEALTALGIPVTTASAVNVCEFTEVKALIDILSLLDNAEQDIPLCSALLSGMGNLTVDDLAAVRLAYKGMPFRVACKKYAREKEDALAEKLTAFYTYFTAVRTEACVLSAGEVLAKILADTQMERGLLAKKHGKACLKRIRRFLEEASSFDGYSVHEFLAHLRNLDYRVDYSENGGENSVKVLTMHSSKGLEFPIVILANLSESFRGGDSVDVYAEEKYGLAPRAFDSEKMLRYSTVLRRLFEVREAQSSRADELNLYYVALTRAEQKLHLIFDERPPVTDVKYARSFAELTDFSVWEEYVVKEGADDPKKQERQVCLQDVDGQSAVFEADGRVVRAILDAFAWEYAHTGMENLPVKSSPTQLMEEGKFIPDQHFKEYGKEEEIEGGEEDERALVVREGTAYHAFLEHFDFSTLVDGDGKPVDRETLSTLVEGALAALSEKEVEKELLSAEKLVEILSNPVFYRLQGMRLYKEQQFLVSLPIKDTYAKKAGVPVAIENCEEEMLFQGAIDLLAVGEEIRVIDYKYSRRGAEALKAHYKLQLDLYKLAVARVMKTEPAAIRCSIVNIRKGFQVDMD